MKNNLKMMVWPSLLIVGFWLFFLFGAGYFSHSWNIFIIILVVLVLQAKSAWKHQELRVWRKPFQTGLVIVLLYWVSYYLFYYFGVYGFWGLVLIGFLFSIYVLIRNWREFMNVIRYIEREFLYDGLTAEERRKQRRKEE